MAMHVRSREKFLSTKISINVYRQNTTPSYLGANKEPDTAGIRRIICTRNVAP
jgi:hypothetical protein